MYNVTYIVNNIEQIIKYNYLIILFYYIIIIISII